MRKEKFQFQTVPNRNEDSLSNWVTDESARTKKGTPAGDSVFFQSLPPGTDNADQEMADIREMRTVTAGTDGVSDNPTASAFRNGFVSSKMKATDPRWGNEHDSGFYESVTVDGSTGFAERGNTLDRH